MELDEKTTAFLNANHDAAMITLRRDGTPHATRIALNLVDGRILSSSTQTRLRTKHLRRDPRCTLFVFETSAQGGPRGARYVSLETTVTIHDGPDAPKENMAFMRSLQPGDGPLQYFGQPRTDEEFLELMVRDQRLLYEFNVTRVYGAY